MRCTRPVCPASTDSDSEHVVARHVEHGGFDLGLGQFTRRVQQNQFLDLLVRGQQVAFHAVGKTAGCVGLFARHHALALLGQALGNPLRQLAAFDGVDLDGDAVALQRQTRRRSWWLCPGAAA